MSLISSRNSARDGAGIKSEASAGTVPARTTSDKSAVPTALVVANEFVQLGLSSFLKGTRFQVVTSAATLSEMDAAMNGQSSPALIIMASEDTDSTNAIRLLRTASADAKLVILGRRSAPGNLPKDVCRTVQAYLDYDVSRDTLIAALTVAMSDATVQPDQPKPSLGFSHQPPLITEQGSAPTQTADVTACHCLSDRELHVLQLLATGASNKEISRTLSVTENTVKVHVKSILRKLQMTNRTRAAIWARENGIYG